MNEPPVGHYLDGVRVVSRPDFYQRWWWCPSLCKWLNWECGCRLEFQRACPPTGEWP